MEGARNPTQKAPLHKEFSFPKRCYFLTKSVNPAFLHILHILLNPGVIQGERAPFSPLFLEKQGYLAQNP